jgi:hypothetical protein
MAAFLFSFIFAFFPVAARYNSSACMPVLRHFMGPEAGTHSEKYFLLRLYTVCVCVCSALTFPEYLPDQINLEGLIEDQPIPASFRQVPG